MLEETVPAALSDERVDRVVAFIIGCPRSAATDLIASGGVRRNDRRVLKGSDRVSEGDVLRIDSTGPEPSAAPVADLAVPLEVIHEDDHVVVVNKAAGVVVHPGAGTARDTLVNGLLARYPEMAGVGSVERPGIVHRLDKGTSGLLMVARTEAARLGLSGQLGARTVERRYVAVVWGHVASDRGLVDAAIGRSKRRRTQMAVVADGRDARTQYSVIRRAADPARVTVIECRLETGRTHQIRVHMSAIGHPVVGDDLYGGQRPSLPFPRPALHAAELGFVHPVSGEPMHFQVDPPADMELLLASLSA